LNPWDFKVVSARNDAPLRCVENSQRDPLSRTGRFGLDELEPFYDKVEYEIGRLWK
jgi:hypothetical protein